MKRAAILLLFLLAAAADALAVGTLIPAPARRDMVHDFIRDRIYITSDNTVLSFDLAAGAFAAPLMSALGARLTGIDISPDGRYLAVADARRTEAQVWIYVIDLQDNSVRQLPAARAFMEGGTYSVAFGATGWILVSSTFEGSGWTPLRRFHPGTGEVVVIPGNVTQSVMLAASGDKTRLGYAESNISDGRWGRYTFATDMMERREWYEFGTSSFNYEIATNRNGSQIAIPAGGVYVYDDALLKIATIGGGYVGGVQEGWPIGVGYHPVENRLYLPWSDSTQVRVYDTNTFTQVGSHDFETEFRYGSAFGTGRVKLSVDGSLLMVGVDGGVRFHRTYASLEAADMRVAVAPGASATVKLAGSIGNGGALAFSILDAPDHGSVVLTGDMARYTPVAGYRGVDRFTYRVVYGQAAAEGEVTINMGRPPIAYAVAASTLEDRPVAVRLRATDPDFEAVTYEIVTPPANGTLLGAAPALMYRPALNFNGTDSFTYRARAGGMESNVATVAVKVAPVNDAPAAVADEATVAPRQAVTIAVLANDYDVDGDPVRLLSVSGATLGTARVVMGKVVYTAWGTPGTATFRYTIADKLWRTATGIVTVRIQ